jgi:hypothetical protein
MHNLHRKGALVASPKKALGDKIKMSSGVDLRSLRQVREFPFEGSAGDEEVSTGSIHR